MGVCRLGHAGVFPGQRFGICGKTVDSASKNIIVPLISMSLAKERYTLALAAGREDFGSAGGGP